MYGLQLRRILREEASIETGNDLAHDPAQPLPSKASRSPEGVAMIIDELEAAHQVVSPAKYLAARRRIPRSSSSSRTCWRRAAISASLFAPADGASDSSGASGSSAALIPQAQRLAVHAQILGHGRHWTPRTKGCPAISGWLFQAAPYGAAADMLVGLGA